MSNIKKLKNSQTKMEAYFLLFTSKHKCQVVEGKIDDGTAYVGDKDFVVDGTQPLLYKKKSLIGSDSYYPFYMVKWDDPNPKTLNDIKNLDSFDIKNHNLNPKMLRKLSETKLFEGLFKHSGDGLLSDNKKGFLLSFGLAVVVGLVIYYLLQQGMI